MFHLLAGGGQEVHLLASGNVFKNAASSVVTLFLELAYGVETLRLSLEQSRELSAPENRKHIPVYLVDESFVA